MPPSTRTYVAKVGTILMVLGCLSLTSCAPDEPLSRARPTPSSTPLFASEEEALDAARATYEGFMSASEEILSSGGVGAERIDDFLSPALARLEKDSYAAYAADGRQFEGQSSIESVSLQRYTADASGTEPVISLYVCVDFSTVDVLDKDGNSTVLSSRPPRIPFEVEFEQDMSLPTLLRISSNTVWAGEGACDE